jgi:hypothetical protein
MRGGGRLSVAALGGLCALATAGRAGRTRADDTRPKAASLTWERAFPVDAEAQQVHFVASFAGKDGGRHTLEVWRRGEAFLRRTTDGQLDMYVVARRGRSGDYDYRLFDHRRHVVTDVERANLYRIGVFSDWFGLAHVVEHPKVAFDLTPADPPGRGRGVSAPRLDCLWRELRLGPRSGQSQSGAEPSRARICWSARLGAPMVIAEPTGKDEWNERFVIERVEPASATAGRGPETVPATPAGWSRIDANREIDPTAGD